MSGVSACPPLMITAPHAGGGDAPRRFAPILRCPHGDSGERFGFRDVRGHDIGQWQQLGHERPERAVVEQPVAALGHHHRIDHERGLRRAADHARDGFDDRGVAEHAGLHRVHREIGDHGADLLDDERRLQYLHRADHLGVLRGDGRDGAQAVDAVRGKGLEVGLDAGAAA